jgi:hypothetical protein
LGRTQSFEINEDIDDTTPPVRTHVGQDAHLISDLLGRHPDSNSLIFRQNSLITAKNSLFGEVGKSSETY